MAQDTGEKKEDYMKKNKSEVKYKEVRDDLPYGEIFEGTFGPMMLIPNFLPPPEELAEAIKHPKITMTVTARTLKYFKSQANRLGSSYQRMMRNLLDAYVEKMEKDGVKSSTT